MESDEESDFSVLESGLLADVRSRDKNLRNFYKSLLKCNFYKTKCTNTKFFGLKSGLLALVCSKNRNLAILLSFIEVQSWQFI